jgi:fructokinase
MSRRPIVAAVGELLWDLLPGGKQLGGAPGNVVHHAESLGAEGILVSRVGRDDLGREALRSLRERGLSADAIQEDASFPTGTAAVRVDPDGQPRFDLAENVAWDHLVCDETARQAVARADAVCFGTLAQRSPVARESLRALLERCGPGTLRVLDLNLRDPFWTEEVLLRSLALAHLLKVSESELTRLAAVLGLPEDPRRRMIELSRKFRLRLLAVTRGAGGSILYSRGEWSEHPGLAVGVRDAVGAGDAFTAVLAVGALRGDSLEAINRRANEVAAFVCTQPGATPRLPSDLIPVDGRTPR